MQSWQTGKQEVRRESHSSPITVFESCINVLLSSPSICPVIAAAAGTGALSTLGFLARCRDPVETITARNGHKERVYSSRWGESDANGVAHGHRYVLLGRHESWTRRARPHRRT